MNSDNQDLSELRSIQGVTAAWETDGQVFFGRYHADDERLTGPSAISGDRIHAIVFGSVRGGRSNGRNGYGSAISRTRIRRASGFVTEP